MSTDGSPRDRSEAARRFYEARDRRTLQYGAEESALEVPVRVRVDQTAVSTSAGRAAARALVEMVMRVHRHVTIDVDGSAPEASELAAVLHHQASSIDPFQDVRPRVRMPGGASTLVVDVTLEPTRSSGNVIATWVGGRGEVWINHARPEGVVACEPVDEEEQLLGAATASCLAAAALFQLAHGASANPFGVNVLERTEGAAASTASVHGPIDVGTVDVIGGGAVALAVAYWASEFGVTGDWAFIDGDDAELHNTNRCLGMTVADAGWPEGEETGVARNKATVAAGLIDADAEEKWFHELPERRRRPDLLLVLANEYGVRSQAASVGEPLLLHATTSSNWTAELHRHLAAGDDDCPGCRIPEQSGPRYECSTGSAQPGAHHSADAALPFLSAMAGLLLVAALLDLPGERRALTGRVNHWRLHLELAARLWQTLPHPRQACPHLLSPAARRAAQSAEPRRWDFLDL